tara:strand:+ start:199 stop:498 length:300 start_codon:yes stop_codon:yes gene_type:complete
MSYYKISKRKPGRSKKEWVTALRKKRAPKKVINAFIGAWEGSEKYYKSKGRKNYKEIAARTAIDRLPKKYLEEPTEAHGKNASRKDRVYILNKINSKVK